LLLNMFAGIPVVMWIDVHNWSIWATMALIAAFHWYIARSAARRRKETIASSDRPPSREAEMKRRIRGTLFAFAAALVLGACASTVPATHSATWYSDHLAGYVHLVNNNGREFFCHEAKYSPYGPYDACYTRAQMNERLLGLRSLGAGASTAGAPQTQPSASIYTSFSASGH